MTALRDAFTARLEPEYTLEDLDQRTAKAAGVLADASGAGDWELAARACTRIAERWDERDALAAAPAWLWQRRALAIETALEAAPVSAWAWSTDADGALEAMWRLWYYALLRGDGAAAGEAQATAIDRAANLRLLEQSAGVHGKEGYTE